MRAIVQGPGGPFYSSIVASAGRSVKLPVTGLASNTPYTYQIECNGHVSDLVGAFRTLPTAPGTPASFTAAFAGDAGTDSSHPVFDAIRLSSPLMFIHLGDLHYQDISTNNVAEYRAAYERIFSSPRQSALYRSCALAYCWDDHDYGHNNSDADSLSHDAACLAYRECVAHYPLADTNPTGTIAQTWDVGRVRFILTDQRSASTWLPRTVLGAAQKAWFKNLLANSPGKVIVWICSRWLRGGSDGWPQYYEELVEIADHIKTHAHGRVIVLSADLHTLGIDNGTNHDFATGGGEPLKVFQAAPLDQGSISGGSYYSQGEFIGVGQWGHMVVADAGGSSIDIAWTGHNSVGATIVTYSFSVNV